MSSRSQGFQNETKTVSYLDVVSNFSTHGFTFQWLSHDNLIELSYEKSQPI